MLNYQISVLHPKTGIQRDGTFYFSERYVDGQWVRFYENVPKKMGGCKVTLFGDNTIIRSMYVIPQATSFYLYMGRSPTMGGVPIGPGSVTYSIISNEGVATAPIDRTPLVNPDVYIPNANWVWQFDTGSFNFPTEDSPTTNLIFASFHPMDMQQTAGPLGPTGPFPIFVGPVNNPDGSPATSPLQPIYDTNMQLVQASGGVLYCAPAIVAYGNNGQITWTGVNAGLPYLIPGSPSAMGSWDTGTNSLNITNTKIVAAANTRGAGAPTMLLWSLNSLSRATLTSVTTGTDTVTTFVNSVVQDNISIIAANAVVNYQQQFFWQGTDQFYVYNGIVQSLPNTMNNTWFYSFVNTMATDTIWSVAVPRYKEIWWFYPRGSATESNACIIYNIEENIWYDNTITTNATGIYNFTRSAGVTASGQYPYPIYADNTLVNNPVTPSMDTYAVWTHEFKVDRVIGSNTFAIPSTFTTPFIDLWTTNDGASNLINNRRLVPDFIQEGVMSVIINTQTYPNSPFVSYGPYPFDSNTEFIDFNCQGGLNSYTFSSNVVGGDYQMGKVLYFYQKGDTLK
jgi:hypothetical protein